MPSVEGQDIVNIPGTHALRALSISLALVGPTLVLAANGQAIAGTTSWPIWSIFALGALCIALVAYSIARLVSSLETGGSAYHIATLTLGDRAGRAVGLTLCSAYLCFALATPSATVGFLTDLAGQPDAMTPGLWSICAAAGVLAAMLLLHRNASVTRLLLMIEGGGIILLILLFCAIIAAPSGLRAAHDIIPPVRDTGISGLFSAVVVAFLSWAGFESCLSLTRETRSPQTDIPRSLYGTVAVTAVLFIAVSWAVQKGFAARLGGDMALAQSQNALGALGSAYLGRWSAVAFGVAAVASSFASTVAAMTAVGHLLGSLFPQALSPGDRATMLVGAFVLLMQFVIPRVPWAEASPVATYGLFASCGAVCVMVAYQAVQIGFIRAIIRRQIPGHMLESGIAAVTFCTISLVLVTSLEQRGIGRKATIAGLAWCLVALIIGTTTAATRPDALSTGDRPG
ncbi:APC family permease [Gluconacetobacter tumulisoli]|uniref:APC family permease n=1 Tax=Gluconacetobacter tumulisoli TaxID=1286189 RepID=A0A7W4K9H8_9PROT|nr:APC family permease [Gluconacetobacter tumulisoli]MBB2202785.1 APC family permease [Gluconacetobacter tumulisoli]